MKKFLLSVLTVIATLCLCFGVACTKEETKTVELVGFTDETHTVEYGSLYLANALATDKDGNEYETFVSVKTKAGEAVEVLHKSFIVLDKQGYTVTYTAEANGEVYTKTDTLTVVANAAPVVTIDGKETAFIIGNTYTVPTTAAYDFFDGELECTTEIYKEAGETDVKCEYDAENGTFTPTETGTYYVQASAKNSADISFVKTLRFFARAEAVAGEWDSFDDEGCEYTNVLDSEVKSVEWHESFEGRDGVLGVSLNATNSYSGSFRMFPKSDDKNQYAGMAYLVVNVYVAGEEGALLNYLFCNPNATRLPMYDIRYNSWNTFVFDASGVLGNWDAQFTSTCDGSNGLMNGTIRKACTMYFDSVYFASAQELTGSATEVDDTVTLGYQAGNAELAYSVTYDGEPVAVSGNTFQAKYVGDYTIYPHIVNNSTLAYAGEPLTYSVEGDSLTVNEYDETIPLGAEEGDYTLPSVTAPDGYKVNDPKTTFTDWSGKSEEKAFDTVKKGYFEFVFTADKAGERSLYKRVRVRVGEYIEGEIFNVSDVTAPARVSTMGSGASIATVDGREIANEYRDTDFLKIAYDVNYRYLMRTAYFNLAPSAKPEDVRSDVYDEIQVSFYVKATLRDGVEMPEMNMGLLGSNIAIKPNEMMNVVLDPAVFAKQYYRLTDLATYADAAFTYSIKAFAEGLTYATTFSELTIYMSDIKAVVRNDIPTPTSILTITESNASDVFNNNGNTVTNGFVSKADFATEGLDATTNGYTGNAVKFTQATAQTHGYFNFNMPILTNKNKAEIRANYTHVKIWIALKATSFCTVSSGLVRTAYFNGGADTGETILLNQTGVWTSYMLPIDAFLSAVDGVASPTILRSWSGSADERAYYFGDIELVKVEPIVFKASSTSLSSGDLSISTGTLSNNSGYVAHDQLPTSLQSGYTGGAIKSSGLYTASYGWKVKNMFTEAQLNKLAETYDTVKIYVAITVNSDDGKVYKANGTEVTGWYYIIGEGLVQYCTNSNSTQYTDTDGDGKRETPNTCYSLNTDNVGVWQEITVSIEDYISYVNGQSEFALFNYWWMDPANGYNSAYKNLDLWLGDVVFA